MKVHLKRSAVTGGIILTGSILLIGGIMFCQFIYGGFFSKETVSAGELKEQFPYEEGSMFPVGHRREREKPVWFWCPMIRSCPTIPSAMKAKILPLINIPLQESITAVSGAAPPYIISVYAVM